MLSFNKDQLRNVTILRDSQGFISLSFRVESNDINWMNLHYGEIIEVIIGSTVYQGVADRFTVEHYAHTKFKRIDINMRVTRWFENDIAEKGTPIQLEF